MRAGNIILVAVAILFPLALSAQARRTPVPEPKPQSRQANDVLSEAEGLLASQQFAQAEEKLAALGESQDKNPQFWFDLGFAQSHQAKDTKAKGAVASYQKAVELAPDWFEANLNLGVALITNNQSADAVPVLKHAVTLKPTSGGDKALGRAWLSLADALSSGTDLLGAAAAYDKAAELTGDVGLNVRAGYQLLRADDLAGAESRYVKAAAAGDQGGMAALIELLTRQKRYADAETWLKRYLKVHPGDSSAVVLLGQTLIAQGKGKEAIELLEPLSTPTSYRINLQLADLYMDDKKYAAAIPLLQKAAEQSPSDARVRLQLGVALLHQLKYADAEAALLKAIELKPDLIDAYSYLADAARQNQHFELCIRALDARARVLPETPATYFLRATAYDGLKMYKPAAENYRQFLALAGGKFPDQEFQARHRLKAIAPQ